MGRASPVSGALGIRARQALQGVDHQLGGTGPEGEQQPLADARAGRIGRDGISGRPSAWIGTPNA